MFGFNREFYGMAKWLVLTDSMGMVPRVLRNLWAKATGLDPIYEAHRFIRTWKAARYLQVVLILGVLLCIACDIIVPLRFAKEKHIWEALTALNALVVLTCAWTIPYMRTKLRLVSASKQGMDTFVQREHDFYEVMQLLQNSRTDEDLRDLYDASRIELADIFDSVLLTVGHSLNAQVARLAETSLLCRPENEQILERCERIFGIVHGSLVGASLIEEPIERYRTQLLLA